MERERERTVEKEKENRRRVACGLYSLVMPALAFNWGADILTVMAILQI